MDRTTHLPMRQAFLKHISSAIARVHAAGQRVAILNIEPGRLRDINNNFGREIGDKVLGLIASRLKSTFPTDIFWARLDGAAFGMSIEGLPLDDEGIIKAQKIAQSIVEELLKPITIDKKTLRLAPHIGIALSSPEAYNSSELLECASMAKMEARNHDGSGAVFYHPAMAGKLKTGPLFETQLWEAIEKNQLVLHYQPVVDLRSGSVLSLEALVRWHHPDMGLVPPGDFLPTIERMGLNEELTLWVLKNAASQLLHWHKLGYKKFGLSINLPPALISKKGLTEKLIRVLQELGIGSHWFTLEILENALMQEAESGVFTLQTMKNNGFGLALDDFGTGYSSLSYLNRFPLTKLKIDRTFIHQASTNAQTRAITETIIKLGKALNLELIAEGVETLDQLVFLRNKGVRLVQGFLLSKPQPAEMVNKLLRPGYFLPFLEGMEEPMEADGLVTA